MSYLKISNGNSSSRKWNEEVQRGQVLLAVIAAAADAVGHEANTSPDRTHSDTWYVRTHSRGDEDTPTRTDWLRETEAAAAARARRAIFRSRCLSHWLTDWVTEREQVLRGWIAPRHCHSTPQRHESPPRGGTRCAAPHLIHPLGHPLQCGEIPSEARARGISRLKWNSGNRFFILKCWRLAHTNEPLSAKVRLLKTFHFLKLGLSA